jgi:hypothetical protein
LVLLLGDCGDVGDRRDSEAVKNSSRKTDENRMENLQEVLVVFEGEFEMKI